MASTIYDDDSSEFTRFLEERKDLFPLNKLLTVWLKTCFLRVFLSIGGGGEFDDIESSSGHLQALLIQCRNSFQSVDQDLRRIWVGFDKFSSGRYYYSCLPIYLDDLLSSAVERLEFLNPVVKQVLSILSTSSRFVTRVGHEVVMENLTLLLKRNEDLMRWDVGELFEPLKEELEASKKSLIFLRNFLGFTAKRCSYLKDLIIHSEFLVGNMSCLLYLCCCVNDANIGMNDQMVKEMKMLFSSQLRKFSPYHHQPGVGEIFFKALKSSKHSAVVDQFDLGFLDSLIDSVLQIPVKPSFMAAFQNLILSLLNELRFLTICFAMFESSPVVHIHCLSVKPGSPYNPMLHPKSNFLLKRISTAITDIGSAIYSLHKNEENMEEAKELKVAVFSLQEIISVTKEDARKSYDLYIPNLWLPRAKIRTKSFIICTLRKILKMIDTIPQTLHSHGLSRHLSEVLKNEILSLIEAFCKLTTKQHVVHKELQAEMAHLIDITYDTGNLISFILTFKVFDWRYKVRVFYLFEEIKKIKRMLSDLRNSSMHKNVRQRSVKHKMAIKMASYEGIKKSRAFSVDMCQIEIQLRWLDNNFDMTSPRSIEIKTLRLTTGFLKASLKAILCCKETCFSNNLRLAAHVEFQALLTRISTVFQSAYQDIRRLWLGLKNQILAKKGWCLPMNMDNILYSVLSSLQLLKPDIQVVYRMLSTHSRCTNYEAVQENFNSLIFSFEESHAFSINVDMCRIENQLRWLDNNLDMTSPQKAEIKALRLTTGFLKAFLSCKGMWHVENGELKVLLTRICTVFQSADQDIKRLWFGLKIQILAKKGWCLPMNMDNILYSVLSRLHLLKPDIQEVYTILSKYLRFTTGLSYEAILENLNSSIENIGVLQKCNAEWVTHLENELETIQNSLRFVRNFLSFIAKRCRKYWKLKDLIIHAELLSEKMSCILFLCLVNDKVNDWMVNKIKLHLSSELQKFSPEQPYVRGIYVKALTALKSVQGKFSVFDEFDMGFLDSLRNHIMELWNTDLSFLTTTRHQILSLLEELQLLINFFSLDKTLEKHSKCDLMSNYLLERINAVIITMGCAIYSLNSDEKIEKMALEKKVSDMVTSVKVAIEYARKMYYSSFPKSLRSNFPRTNGHGFITFLLQYLKELLNTQADSVSPLKHNIEMVQKEVISLMEDFSGVAKQCSQFEELQSQWSCFLGMSYQIEYLIDSFLSGGRPLFFHKMGLFIAIEEIKKMKTEFNAIKYQMMNDEILVEKPYGCSCHILVGPNFPVNKEEKNSTGELVIFGEEAEEIKEQLTHGSKKLTILSIVGMPGIGKTTLADSIFNHSSVTYHFHIRARCSVSQVHDRRRLLLEILHHLTDASKQYSDDDDLDQKLYQSLKGRRYLILMDDIWDIRSWLEIKDSFPNDNKGSRIIFTSRFGDIATLDGLESINYPLSPISEEQCWQMLKLKLFANKRCTPELARIGRDIAANCKGLPLTVELMAGVLQVEESKNWKKVAAKLTTLLLEDPQGRCRKVLELSYGNLPDDLKPCFLYFAAFPEDAHIPTRELISLWIAEGFVQLEKCEKRSLENGAEDILNNLISRNLISVSKRGKLGRVEASRVHDLLHEFALAKALEERFMQIVDGIKFSHLFCRYQWQEQYRLSIYPDNWEKFLESKPSCTRTRVLICSYSPSFQNALSLNFSAFQLLKVLYIPELLCNSCPELFTLIHLRVLAIESSDSMIFSKVHMLKNLETFIMRRLEYTKKQHAYLSLEKVCNLVRLRNFCFGGYISLTYHREKAWERLFVFNNLQSLYHLKVSYAEDIEKILKLMPNLVKLKLLVYNSGEGCLPFPFLRLDFLKKLESLELTLEDFYSSYPNCRGISFPPYLKCLVLSNTCMPWTEILEIGNLEYLELLKLEYRAFEGPIWDMIDGQFPKLRCLSLSNLDIERWNASEDHLSCLEELHLKGCRQLEELPFCLAEIATLQVIKLRDCSLSAENSARTIKEEQERAGNQQLVLDVYRSEDVVRIDYEAEVFIYKFYHNLRIQKETLPVPVVESTN